MVTAADVHLWGQQVGTVLWDEHLVCSHFEYAPEFIRGGLEVSPIMMPLARKVYSFPDRDSYKTFLGLPGMLAEALPDAFGRALLDNWLAAQGRQDANPVERLCFQGKRSMGALEFVPSMERVLDAEQAIEVDSLVQAAHEALSNKEAFVTNLSNSDEALLDIIRVGTSAGGQRAKAVIAYNDATGEVRSGQTTAPDGFDYWLLKLDGVTNKVLGDPEHWGEVEYVHSLIAKAAGIHMTECRLYRENGRAHFMTKRFDRVNGEKIHMQTLCGLAHYDFNMLHAYSYEQAFAVMRQLRLTYPEAEEFYRRMVFNVVARNQDDHTKNISFLMDKNGVWHLSPAYDMSWAYNPTGGWTSMHQMSINNKWDNITREDLLHVAYEMNIKHAPAIIDQVVEAVSMWSKLAKEQTDIPQNIIDAIEKTRAYL
ncbi:MAG: type II toxin-antitoxin system HipA family toxin [Paludibacteraceae bacterium]|nr:type II toxin-antitoxin system HipA family toxin [Paludibacteraceae bacterium]